MPTVTVFVPGYNKKQQEVLAAFAEGIPDVRVQSLSDPYTPCDIAVLFGLYKTKYKETWPKKDVLDKHCGSRLIVVDSAYVRRGEYWNVGFGGINGGADFRTDGVPNDRWLGLGVPSKPWRQNPTGPIVVCGQVPWDVAVQYTDHVLWIHRTLEWFLAQGEKKVLFRPHPRVKKEKWADQYDMRRVLDGVGIDLRPTSEMLKDARLVVTWNSNTAVEAAIAGVPVITQDSGSGAYVLGNHELRFYKDPRCPSRRQWLAAIGYSQWNLDEMRSGLPWRHLTRGV